MFVFYTQASRSRSEPPTWIGWSNGTEINISENPRKYSTANGDGDEIFYLLITGIELDLHNTGDKYACHNPRSTQTGDELRQLEQNAAVLKVLPNERKYFKI